MNGAWLLLMCATATQTPASTATPVATTETDPAHAVAAVELAETLNSEALTRVQIEKLLSDTFPKTFAQNPDFAAMEKEYPGVIAALVAGMRPILIETVIKMLPGMWRELGPIYGRALTTGEIRQLLAFYRSPAGVRVIDAMARGADYTVAVRRMLDTGTSDVTVGDLKSGAAPGVAEVIRGASAEDMAQMTALMTTDAGRKLPAVTVEVQKRVAAWSSRPDPEFDAKMEKLTVDILTAYTAKSKTK